MTDLIMPTDGPRVSPRTPEQVNANVRAELDKATETWGIPNNLARTMACHPRLAQTEIDYVNSFIFDENVFGEIPRPGNLEDTVLFPQVGFVDRVTKELVIAVVSLINRSRYSITHHAVISWGVLAERVAGATAAARESAPAQQRSLEFEETDADKSPQIETTDWGRAQRLVPPVQIDNVPMHWQLPARRLGSGAPRWLHY